MTKKQRQRKRELKKLSSKPLPKPLSKWFIRNRIKGTKFLRWQRTGNWY